MSYEFSATENQIISKTGKRTKLWGMMMVGGGLLIGLLGFSAAMTSGSFDVSAGVLYALLALIPIVIGQNFVHAGKALGSVVTTEGNDIDHLMSSMAGLGTAFLIQAAAAALWAALVLVGIALAVATPSLGGG